MIVKIDYDKCLEYNLSLQEAAFLYEAHYNNKVSTTLYSPLIVTSLLKEEYLLSIDPYILSAKGLDVIGLVKTEVNPNEFIDLFPHRVRTAVGWRSVRPKDPHSATYKSLCAKYLEKVSSITKHQQILRDTEAYVKYQMSLDDGFYMTSVINAIMEQKWDSWNGLYDEYDIKPDYGESV